MIQNSLSNPPKNEVRLSNNCKAVLLGRGFKPIFLMNTENLTELIHKGFRVTLSATSSLIEILQDPYKHDQNLEKDKSKFSELTDEWAEKGQVTEREARNFVDTILSQRSSSSYPESTTVTTSPSVSVPTSIPIKTDPEPVREIQDLTTQIAELKDELKRLQDQ